MSRSDEYKKYLRGPEWKDHRELALARTSGFCQFCGEVAENVHHVKYPKRFGDEHPHSLLPVCRRCHDVAHGVQPMKSLQNVTQMTELTPFGGRLKYLFSGGRVYASGKSWAKALQIPEPLSTWFDSGLSRIALLKKDLAGGSLEMIYLNTPVYRWHAVAEHLRAFDHNWVQHQYRSRPHSERIQLERFHDNYERLVSWGYDLQERALSSALQEKTDPTAAVSQDTLIEALKQAVAPRLQDHDNKIHEHDVVIGEMRGAIPTLRDQDEFISVRQAIGEQGLDPTQMPLHSRSGENLSALTGRILKDKRIEQGPFVLTRIDGQRQRIQANTYRRRDVYAALADILRNKQDSLFF